MLYGCMPYALWLVNAAILRWANTPPGVPPGVLGTGHRQAATQDGGKGGGAGGVPQVHRVPRGSPGIHKQSPWVSREIPGSPGGHPMTEAKTIFYNKFITFL